MIRSRVMWAALSAILYCTTAAATPQVVSLSDFCTPDDNADDSVCIQKWADTAAAKGKDLYVPPGVWLYSRSVRLYSNSHIRCAGPGASIFRNNGNAGHFFGTSTNIENITIEDCGFDMNGDDLAFLSVIGFNPAGADPSNRNPVTKNVRVRGNRIFDSTTNESSTLVRDAISLLDCLDCWIEGNHLSGGARIKAGRPGSRLFIRNNILDYANDSAIAVVDVTGGMSRDIQITNNLITNPVHIGIFFGADGEASNQQGMQSLEIQVRENHVRGDWKLACIRGTLPHQAHRIHVTGNMCLKTPGDPLESDAAGIDIGRVHPLIVPTPPRKPPLPRTRLPAADEILISSNTVSAMPPRRPVEIVEGYLKNGGIKMTGPYQAVRIVNNDVRNVGKAALLLKNVNIRDAVIANNVLTGGALDIRGPLTGNITGNIVASSEGDGFRFNVDEGQSIAALVSDNTVWSAKAACVRLDGPGRHEVDLIGNAFRGCTEAVVSGTVASGSVRMHNRGDAPPHAVPTRHLHAKKVAKLTMPAGKADHVDLVVSGAAPGDIAIASLDAITAGEFQISAYVTGPDTVRVVVTNLLPIGQVALEGTVRVQVWKLD